MMDKIFSQLSKQHKWLIVSISFITLFLILLPSESANASKSTPPNDDTLEVGKAYKLSINLPEETPQTLDIHNPKTPNITTREITVRKGDNLAKIFQRAGFSAQILHNVIHTDSRTKRLRKIHPGDTLTFYSKNKRLEKLVYPLSITDTLIISARDNDKFKSEISVSDIETRPQFASATISSNFWNAGSKAGLTDAQIMGLANIFGWDIDFANDIRKGDSFNILYEEQFIDGEYIGRGNILAAEFVNQDEKFIAVRHKDGAFYTPQGRSMRKAFLRAPVNFKYVSSNFNPRRFHPVQKRWKAHNGVDYAAKKGTPVVAAGNGKVIAATYNKYNGNYVFIQHGDGIVTKYLHFSKRAVKKGQRVKQGQVIGYVGATGLAAGPHLHYEFVVNGKHRNPRTVKLPKARPLPKKEREAFTAYCEEVIAKLEDNKRILVAYSDEN